MGKNLLMESWIFMEEVDSKMCLNTQFCILIHKPNVQHSLVYLSKKEKNIYYYFSLLKMYAQLVQVLYRRGTLSLCNLGAILVWYSVIRCNWRTKDFNFSFSFLKWRHALVYLCCWARFSPKRILLVIRYLNPFSV